MKIRLGDSLVPLLRIACERQGLDHPIYLIIISVKLITHFVFKHFGIMYV